MTKETPKPLKPLADAIKEVQPAHNDPNHALVIYQKHYKGRETEIPFADFLAAIPSSKPEDE